MINRDGNKFIKLIRSRWIYSGWLASLFLAFSIALILTTIVNLFYTVPHWFTPILGTILTFIIAKKWGISKIKDEDAARLLNQSYPVLEESTSLLLRDKNSLNILEKLQLEKLRELLKSVAIPVVIYRRVKFSSIILLLSLSASHLVAKMDRLNLERNVASKLENKSRIKEKILPEISSISLKISPPSYTNRPTRVQDQFSVIAEEGSTLEWTIETNQSVENLNFIFNDQEIKELKALNNERRVWTFKKNISKSGFYQVNINEQLSDLYKLEIIKDEPALIRILSPKQYSTIDIGEPKRINLKVQVEDDYGLKDVFISATSASGKGEGVQFKERIIQFNEKIEGEKKYNLNKIIELGSLGMKPGDELYFFIQASDKRNQISRSEVYQVSIQDTASLMSMDGMIGGVNLVPEYFRSQRQIIIDAEKIIKEKNSTREEDFKSRSNNLGIDQKLLRLRYGKFLGEESEGEIGPENEDHEGHEGHDEEEGADFGNAQKIMDSYAHKHDIAEDATFFEPELKAQLKATLTEMWKSELKLRTYKPEEALPFAYKALRLLKDLQQKSRAYVSKTAIKTASIKLEKRLTGELDKIKQPSIERKLSPNDAQLSLKKGTELIARLKSGSTLNQQELLILKNIRNKIAAKAQAEPENYLNALKTLRKIISATTNFKPTNKEISDLEFALQKLIQEENRSPKFVKKPSKTTLSEAYFKQLKQEQP